MPSKWVCLQFGEKTARFQNSLSGDGEGNYPGKPGIDTTGYCAPVQFYSTIGCTMIDHAKVAMIVEGILKCE